MSHSISQSLLPEFDHEVANTRKTLERVPENNPDFRPHLKSMPMAHLAGHLADVPLWAVMTLTQGRARRQSGGGTETLAHRHAVAR